MTDLSSDRLDEIAAQIEHDRRDGYPTMLAEQLIRELRDARADASGAAAQVHIQHQPAIRAESELADARVENERRWAAVGCAACRASDCSGHLAAEASSINGHAVVRLEGENEEIRAELADARAENEKLRGLAPRLATRELLDAVVAERDQLREGSIIANEVHRKIRDVLGLGWNPADDLHAAAWCDSDNTVQGAARIAAERTYALTSIAQIRARAVQEIADAKAGEQYHAEVNNGAALMAEQARRSAWETVTRLAAAQPDPTPELSPKVADALLDFVMLDAELRGAAPTSDSGGGQQ